MYIYIYTYTYIYIYTYTYVYIYIYIYINIYIYTFVFEDLLIRVFAERAERATRKRVRCDKTTFLCFRRVSNVFEDFLTLPKTF